MLKKKHISVELDLELGEGPAGHGSRFKIGEATGRTPGSHRRRMRKRRGCSERNYAKHFPISELCSLVALELLLRRIRVRSFQFKVNIVERRYIVHHYYEVVLHLRVWGQPKGFARTAPLPRSAASFLCRTRIERIST